jgi:hypothetical protein
VYHRSIVAIDFGTHGNHLSMAAAAALGDNQK